MESVQATLYMIYGSVCSGIEAASVAWEPLGMRPAWFSEIERFPSSVLERHWPHVPNLGDMRGIPDLIGSGIVEAPDILVGGTPCQSFSVAGLRKGLSDDRGKLVTTFVEILDAMDERRTEPAVCVWENVPGVLSNRDNAFGCFLGLLAGENMPLHPSGRKWSNAGCVYGPKRTVAWRVLDAQYFGLAQRRKRVFVVASAGNRINPITVLFEREGLRRDTAPCRKERKEVAAVVDGCLASGKQSTGSLTASQGEKLWLGNQEALTGDFHVVHGTQDPLTSDVAFPIGTNQGQENAVIPINDKATRTGDKTANGLGIGQPHDPSPTLTASDKHGVFIAPVLRRLTPIECERLQGFPDNHTRVPSRGKYPDGPRYKAIGNSFAVPVVRWIGMQLIKENA